MKAILTAIAAILVSFGTKAQEFKLFFTLQTDQSMQKALGNVKVIYGDVYVVGAFTGTNTIPNGQSASYNGVLKFPHGDLTQPQGVAGGITSPQGKGMYDIAGLNGQLYIAGESSTSSSKIFTFDEQLGEWVATGVQADTKIEIIDSVSPTKLLLAGKMTTVNNVSVNKLCLYDVVSNTVTPISGMDQYDEPVRAKWNGKKLLLNNKFSIGIFDSETFTYQPISGGPSPVIDFIGHGDTLYAVGPGSVGNISGDVLIRKIGAGAWEAVAIGNTMHTASLSYLPEKQLVHMVGSFTELIAPSGAHYPGTDLGYSEKDNGITTSPVTTVNGMWEYIKLPNGGYIGWSDGNLFTTELVSSVPIVEKETISFYPNPASNYVTISGSTATTISLTNIAGQKIIDYKITNSSIDLSGLNPGTYFLGNKVLIISR